MSWYIDQLGRLRLWINRNPYRHPKVWVMPELQALDRILARHWYWVRQFDKREHY